MRKKIFELLILLEEDLSKVYNELNVQNRDVHLIEVFDYMHTHCQEHAEQISALMEEQEKFEVNEESIILFHKNIKNALREKISPLTRPTEVLDLLKSTEVSMGKLYQSIAGHFWKLAQYYDRIGNDLEHLAGEEIEHGDIIEQRKLKPII